MSAVRGYLASVGKSHAAECDWVHLGAEGAGRCVKGVHGRCASMQLQLAGS